VALRSVKSVANHIISAMKVSEYPEMTAAEQGHQWCGCCCMHFLHCLLQTIVASAAAATAAADCNCFLGAEDAAGLTGLTLTVSNLGLSVFQCTLAVNQVGIRTHNLIGNRCEAGLALM
jgi:hypothetical protein